MALACGLALGDEALEAAGVHADIGLAHAFPRRLTKRRFLPNLYPRGLVAAHVV
jgi:hypothetical protein